MLTFRGFRRDARQPTLKVSLRMSTLTLLLVSLVSAFERPSFTETPAAVSVAPGQTATFRCRAVGDPDPEVVWFKGRRERAEGVRFTTTEEGDLLISDVRPEDGGEYLCAAGNRAGLISAITTLTLQGGVKPNPPRDVQLNSCGPRVATVSWRRAPRESKITQYVLEYNTSYADHHRDLSCPGSEDHVSLILVPYTTYTFQVRARNAFGLSDPSAPMAECSMPPARPYKNPRNVCVKNIHPHQLVITWKPMERKEHNGPDLKYVVTYKPYGRRGPWRRMSIMDPSVGVFVVGDTPTYSPYEISVSAENAYGASHSPALRIIGYSGENTPNVVPANFAVDPNTVNSESAEFTFDAIDEQSPDVRGFFKGYEVSYWKQNAPDDKRSTVLIKREPDTCTGAAKRGRKSAPATSGRERMHVGDLWPNSDIVAVVRVVNMGYSGPPSAEIMFATPDSRSRLR